jgi:hypothetical protein
VGRKPVVIVEIAMIRVTALPGQTRARNVLGLARLPDWLNYLVLIQVAMRIATESAEKNAK